MQEERRTLREAQEQAAVEAKLETERVKAATQKAAAAPTAAAGAAAPGTIQTGTKKGAKKKKKGGKKKSADSVTATATPPADGEGSEDGMRDGASTKKAVPLPGPAKTEREMK